MSSSYIYVRHFIINRFEQFPILVMYPISACTTCGAAVDIDGGGSGGGGGGGGCGGGGGGGGSLFIISTMGQRVNGCFNFIFSVHFKCPYKANSINPYTVKT